MKKGSAFLTNDPTDELALLLNDRYMDRRHDIWLWLYLSMRLEQELAPESCNGQTMRNEIAIFLRRHRGFQDRIPYIRDQSLLPKKNLEWLENDERQSRWLLPRIERITGERLPSSLTRLSGRDRLIATIDIWDAKLQDKELAVEYLKKDWLNHKIKDSDFKWFADKKDGTKRCICAWEWIEKHYSPRFSLTPPFSNYQELLIFFDDEQLDRYGQRDIVDKIKTKWHNAQHQARTSHMKQVNVKIPLEVIDQLKSLQEKHDLKAAEVVEKLIRMETQLGAYLTRT